MEAWESNWVDYYRVLGVASDAEPEILLAVYRTLAKKYHPDNGTQKSSSRMASINVAYEVLGDPKKRAAYDQAYRTRSSGSGSSRSSTPSGSGSTRSSRSSGSSAPPPPPKTYHSVIAVDEPIIIREAKEGDPVNIAFTVRLVSGEIGPKEKLQIKYDGAFLASASMRMDPPDRLPTQVTITVPYIDAGDHIGNIEVSLA